MEYFDKNSVLEELLALKSSDSLEASMLPMVMSEHIGWDYDYNAFGGNHIIPTSKNVQFEDFSSLQIDPQILSNNSSFGEFMTPFDVSLSSPFTPSQQVDKFLLSFQRDEDQVILANALHNLENHNIMEVGQCKVEQMDVVGVTHSSSTETKTAATFNNLDISNSEGNKESKKLNCYHSKNLMAERRRRNRLNDRLSMLRSVVPKISKMDRTSILGDTIDYIKEMLDTINRLQEEMDQEGPNQTSTFMNNFHAKPNEVLVRNSPKFNVERRNMDTRIDISCAPKPGLLLSTVTTLESLGLEIEQCTLSCFNDFTIQASCSKEAVERGDVTSEDVKQSLFRNAGYCGTCL